MKCKNIEAFVRHSIKADTTVPDDAELQRLLDQMSTPEMQRFWMHFAAERAFSTATTTVPHWKTKEQESCFQHEHISYMFYPKDKDESGKYIIVRKDLEEHIKTNLIKHIHQERRLEQAYRIRPLFDRLHARIGFSIVLMAYLAIPIGICLLIFSSLLHIGVFTAVAAPAIFVFVALCGLYLLMPLVRVLLRKCNLWKDTPHDA
ncbi:MAG: hypothetical protein ABSB84_13290 [Verrucomicrobiota bacterium]|jgi:hypothetical protein